MIWLFCYIFVYCNIEPFLNKYYLGDVTNPYIDTQLLSSNLEFIYSIKAMNQFIIGVYAIYITHFLFFSKSHNKYSLVLSFVYVKYILEVFFNDHMRFCDLEFSRYIMWVFATPLMLKMYCDVNQLSIYQINIHYHMIPACMNVAVYPYKYTNHYYVFMGIAYILYGLFFMSLYKHKDKKFTNIFLTIWFLFCVINTLDLVQIINMQYIQVFYNVADMIGKVTTNFVIHDYREQELHFIENIDLQCTHFISAILKHIQTYIDDNKKMSDACKKFIGYVKERFVSKIPENRDALKHELLAKILPLGMDKTYLADANSIGNSIQFEMICVLFTDIVNYTELAKQYDDKTIFDLLNNIYRQFDTIIQKYPHLQKIETIGDAYMVVGDIYRTQNNHMVVIKEIVEIGIEFIKSIKSMSPLEDNVLSIRVGINLGKVTIGILGNEIPRLCVVGNAVNVAARLQSTADEDSIQMSRHIYEKLEEIDFGTEYEIIKKDNVFLKNIGSVTTYNITPIIMEK